MRLALSLLRDVVIGVVAEEDKRDGIHILSMLFLS